MDSSGGTDQRRPSLAHAAAGEQMQVFSRFLIPSHVLTHHGTIVCANWEPLGYTHAADVVGKHFAEFVYPAVLSRTGEEVVRAVLADSRPGVPVPVTLRSKAGDRVYYNMAIDRVDAARVGLPAGPGATTATAAAGGAAAGAPAAAPTSPPPAAAAAAPTGAVGGSWVDHSKAGGNPPPHYLCVLHPDVPRHTAAAGERQAAALGTYQDAFLRRIFHKMRTPLHIMCNALDAEDLSPGKEGGSYTSMPPFLSPRLPACRSSPLPHFSSPRPRSLCQGTWARCGTTPWASWASWKTWRSPP